MRLLFSAALVMWLGWFATALENKKPEEPKTIAERFRAIQKEYREETATLEKALTAAKTAGEKNAIQDKLDALQPKFAEKVVALAAADPKDPAAFKAATFALFELNAEGATAKQAADIISENHADNPKLKPLIPDLSEIANGRALLKAIHEKATNKEVKGATLYFIALKTIEEADDPSGGTPLTAEKQASVFKDAETLLNKAAKEYGDVVIGTEDGKQSIAKAVEGQRYFLNNLTVGKVLPDSACEDLDGKKVKISDYRGKVVVLDIWATWCGPCRAMIPHERELVKNLKDKPFVFISLSADDKKGTLTKFLAKEPMPWVHWWNGDPKAGPVVDYRVQFYPTIYVLDHKGVIRFKHVREKAMDEAIEGLLKEIQPKN